jgi:transporter family-2 protein
MGELAWFVTLALLTGVGIAVQTGVNTQLRSTVGTPLVAAFVSFSVGTALLAVIVAGSRMEVPIARLARMPWWMWAGGLLGVFIVSTNIVVAPRLGAALLLSLAITGQLAASLVLDHYGAFGFPVHPISAGRIVGALLLVGGVVLVRYT